MPDEEPTGQRELPCPRSQGVLVSGLALTSTLGTLFHIPLLLNVCNFTDLFSYLNNGHFPLEIMAISPDNRGRISFCSLIYCQCPAQCLKCTWWLEVFLLNACFRIPPFFFFFFSFKASGWGKVGRWKVTKIHPWKDQVARLSHEGTQLRVAGTEGLSCEAVQALSQTAWVQIPVLWLTSHAVISSLPSVSIPQSRDCKSTFFLSQGSCED